MSSSDLAAVVVTVCVVVALAALIVVLTQAFALMREFRRKLADFDAKVGPALSQLADTAEMAQAEISRLRDLLNIAQKVAGMADAAGGAAARVAGVPVDKVRSAVAALRGKAADEGRENARGGQDTSAGSAIASAGRDHRER
ncbi:hypothetical protein [Candidatus Poriferisodalis sp.]|uniref:hypothetical protein n=1 Tax=Candidatus Poriferisodalis sp. TaxID=3101277 RepID=UPI003B0251D0